MEAGTSDRAWLAQALALAALADGGTSPNPRVGCLLVREGRVVGRGLHRGAGRPHAESEALREAGRAARGSTLYINLEPCAHQGRTPPCVERIVGSGVRRVVASMQDPDERVDGRGFEELRQAGVEVEVGLLGAEARRLNEPFLHWHRCGLPLVTLKAAVSLDGRLAAAEGRSRWISGPHARRFAHRLRLRSDAILVGAGTVRRDDPRLTVRLPGCRVARHRVVLSRTLDLDPQAALFGGVQEGAPAVRVYAPREVALREGGRFAGRAEIVGLPGQEDELDLRAVLRDLAALGVRSLLVEGGGRTFSGFLRSGLADRAALFVAGRLLGDRGAAPLLDQPVVARPAEGWILQREQLLPLGQDLLLLGRLRAGG